MCTQLKAGPRAVLPTSTARSVAERCIAKASCSSVRLFVCNVEVSWSGWNSEKIISRLISLTISPSADPDMTDLLQREHPQTLAGIGVGYEKLSTFDI